MSTRSMSDVLRDLVDAVDDIFDEWPPSIKTVALLRLRHEEARQLLESVPPLEEDDLGDLWEGRSDDLFNDDSPELPFDEEVIDPSSWDGGCE